MAYPLAEKPHQILAPDGTVVGDLPDLSDEKMLEYFRWMKFGRIFSDRMIALQRQGRMGTFGPLNGQEAASIGIAAPLQQEDWLVGSYREIISYFIKGVRPLDVMKTYRGHIGAEYPKDARCLPIQIVLATQMLHAAGIAMGIKYEGKSDVVVGVCGDGATSEGDFNETLNFMSVFQAPMVAVVQNNGWAISVPRSYQTKAEYIAHRGPGFGMPGYVVDGNDIFAMVQVMTDCVARARAGDGPSLVEAITYRLGAHTTADDPTKYRPDDDLEYWSVRDPLIRYRAFLIDKNMVTEQEEVQMEEEIRAELEDALAALDALLPQDPTGIFDLVYEEPTAQLIQQRSELIASWRGE